MKKIISILSVYLIISCLILVPAQAGMVETTEDIFVNNFDFSSEWFQTSASIATHIVLPFLGVVLIVYGFLTTLGMFGRGRNAYYGILSVAISSATIGMGWFAILVRFVFGLMGIWSIGLFAVMFFAGTYLLARNYINRLGFGISDVSKRIDETKEELRRVNNRLADQNELPEDEQSEALIEQLSTEKEHLEEKLNSLRAEKKVREAKRDRWVDERMGR